MSTKAVPRPPMIKTYVDANALIAAFGGNHPAPRAEHVVIASQRGRCAMSLFLRLLDAPTAGGSTRRKKRSKA